jgi:hypothetical protein
MDFSDYINVDKDLVLSLYNAKMLEFSNKITCLANISVNFKIKPACMVKSTGCCEKSLHRRIKSILRGEGDGNSAFY